MKRKTVVSQMMSDVDNYPMDMEPMPRDTELKVNPGVNLLGTNPQIENFAKPSSSVVVKDSDGTIHSFAVEIKSSKNGPIPDTQLMSKILEAVEGSTPNEFASDGGEPTKFDVVRFKCERLRWQKIKYNSFMSSEDKIKELRHSFTKSVREELETPVKNQFGHTVLNPSDTNVDMSKMNLSIGETGEPKS